MTFEEVGRQLDDVRAALAQRRHAEVHTSEPVEKVGAKQLPIDHVGEAAVGGRDDADVDALRAGAAHPFHRQILDGPQQLGLGRERKVGHLVEEQRAAVGMFELAAATAHASGRAIFDAEQLGLEQRLDEGGAVDGDERPLPPRAQLVDLAGDKLFANTRFALE